MWWFIQDSIFHFVDRVGFAFTSLHIPHFFLPSLLDREADIQLPLVFFSLSIYKKLRSYFSSQGTYWGFHEEASSSVRFIFAFGLGSVFLNISI